MGLFQDIKDFFSGGSSKSGGSKSKSSGKGSKPTAKSTASSLATDVKMGLATFGQGKEEQAQTLRDLGYSEKSIQSYQERSAASLERAMAEQERISKDDGPSSTVVAEETATEETAAEDTTTPVDDKTSQIQTVADVVTKKTPQTASTGPAEDKAREFEKKGRKATVLTSMQGLDDEIPMTAEELKKLRSRRSLLAG